MNGNQMRAKNNVTFKRKNAITKLRPNQNLRGNKPRNGVRKPLPTRKPVTADQLDQDLDGYMAKTKGFLNAELDAYMSQT